MIYLILWCFIGQVYWTIRACRDPYYYELWKGYNLKTYITVIPFCWLLGPIMFAIWLRNVK